MSLRLICVAGSLLLCLHARAQRVYSVGDTVPNLVFAPLLSGQPFYLSDLSGTLVLLDFWETWCKSCVEALPKLQALQQLFPGQLQVVGITRFADSAQLGHTVRKQQVHLPIVLHDTLLYQLFPHGFVSHIVWLDQARVVRALTHAHEVTAERVREMLRNSQVNWPVKRDTLGPGSPLFFSPKPLP